LDNLNEAQQTDFELGELQELEKILDNMYVGYKILDKDIPPSRIFRKVITRYINIS